MLRLREIERFPASLYEMMSNTLQNHVFVIFFEVIFSKYLMLIELTSSRTKSSRWGLEIYHPNLNQIYCNAMFLFLVDFH